MRDVGVTGSAPLAGVRDGGKFKRAADACYLFRLQVPTELGAQRIDSGRGCNFFWNRVGGGRRRQRDLQVVEPVVEGQWPAEGQLDRLFLLLLFDVLTVQDLHRDQAFGNFPQRHDGRFVVFLGHQ